AACTVTAADEAEDEGTDSQTITHAPDLAITTTVLPRGEVGTAYTHCVSAVGIANPWAWSEASRTIPTGLTFDAAESETLQACFSGTPSNEDTYAFAIEVTDDDMVTDTQAFSVEIVAEGALEEPADYFEFQISRDPCSAMV